MRHGKSSWELNVSDKDRPLNQRGIDDAQKMGAYLQNQTAAVGAGAMLSKFVKRQEEEEPKKRKKIKS